jgi:hypothetical protein
MASRIGASQLSRRQPLKLRVDAVILKIMTGPLDAN